MTDKVTINTNTAEEVAYKLMRDINYAEQGAYNSKEKMLSLYEECFKVTRGHKRNS